MRLQVDREGSAWDELKSHIFSREYLLERPLLRAISAPVRTVLLIDEVDKADEELEAFLLEVLAEYQVTVPELGTLAARERPVVVLTSNQRRELSEALKRRCLHLHLDFPGVEKEREIIARKVPALDERLRDRVAEFVAQLRRLGLKKSPSIAETLDWARALVALGIRELDGEAVRRTLAVLLKHEEDIRKAEPKIAALKR
jgi:MoxR-like ATPase